LFVFILLHAWKMPNEKSRYMSYWDLKRLTMMVMFVSSENEIELSDIICNLAATGACGCGLATRSSML